MSSVAVRYYIDHVSPASLETTFTWTTDKATQKLYWQPIFFNTVSHLYEASKPSPPWTTFEINYRQTVKNDNVAYLFHYLVSPSPGWDPNDPQLPSRLIEKADKMDLTFDHDDNPVFNIDDIYWALELCHFLQIEANDYAVQRAFADTQGTNLKVLIPYHQIFLRVQYKRGLQACEERFTELYYQHLFRLISSVPGQMHISYLNEIYLCKVKAYVDFASRSQHLSETTKTFLKEILGWEDQMQIFGVWIDLTTNQFIQM